MHQHARCVRLSRDRHQERRRTLHYTIAGPGEIVAVDNGDQTSLAPIQGTNDSSALHGLALVIVRAQAGHTGRITLTATADGLTSGSVALSAQPRS